MPLTAAQKRDRRAAQKVERDKAAAAAKASGAPSPDELLNQERMLHPDQAPSATGEILRPASAGGKVVVACKVGVPYIDLQLQRQQEVWENTQTGPRKVNQWARFGAVVRIRGTAYPRGTVPDGFPEKPRMAFGAALTEGVDEDFMKEWLRQNHQNPLVINSMIFIAENEANVAAIAREHQGRKSGLEPMDPKGDPRMPKPTNAAVSPIETEEGRVKKAAANA